MAATIFGRTQSVKEKPMRRLKFRLVAACLIVSLAATPAAWAQWAVVDAPAIVQLIQEVQTMAQQLQTAKAQLLQAKQALQTMTGDRGMELLLSGTVRNYLPSDWTQVTGALQGSGGFGALSAEVQSIVSANAVLSPQRLATLSPAAQRLIQNLRQWSAMQQALSHQALANASSRFASIQSLITAIPSATDQKGILDLQARVSAELGMLENEQTKVQILNQATQAQRSALGQLGREQVIDGHGSFAARFQPAP
jgi:type IV secretion system protein VirB5